MAPLAPGSRPLTRYYDRNPLEATRRLLADHPDLQVVVLTSFSDQDQVLDAGAVGYLLKDADPADLLQSVRAAAAGQSPLDPKVARTLLTRRTEQAPQDQLSDREREVLTLVADGWPTSRSPAT